MQRASSETLEAQSTKTLSKQIKDGEVILTLKSKIRDELRQHNIEDFYDDYLKDRIIQNTMTELYEDDFFSSKLEADAYYYKIEAKYDGLIKKLESIKKQEEKQKQIEAEENQAQRREDIKTVLKGLRPCFIDNILPVYIPRIYNLSSIKKYEVTGGRTSEKIQKKNDQKRRTY